MRNVVEGQTLGCAQAWFYRRRYLKQLWQVPLEAVPGLKDDQRAPAACLVPRLSGRRGLGGASHGDPRILHRPPQRRLEALQAARVKQHSRQLGYVAAQTKKVGVRFQKLLRDLSLAAVSDSAFKAQEFEGLAAVCV